jgi:hypothetical protein
MQGYFENLDSSRVQFKNWESLDETINLNVKAASKGPESSLSSLLMKQKYESREYG